MAMLPPSRQPFGSRGIADGMSRGVREGPTGGAYLKTPPPFAPQQTQMQPQQTQAQPRAQQVNSYAPPPPTNFSPAPDLGATGPLIGPHEAQRHNASMNNAREWGAQDRGEDGLDTSAHGEQMLGLLSSLKKAGYNFGGDDVSTSSSGAGQIGAGGTWTPSTGVGAPAGIPGIAPVDTSAAQAAAFARAKDQAGQTASGALAGLRSSLGGRGMLGSGAESRGSASVINRGQGELGDVTREQAIESAELAQRTAETNYQGAISQRNSDMSSADTRRGQDLTARGQDMASGESSASRRQANMQSILGLFSSLHNRRPTTGGPSTRY